MYSKLNDWKNNWFGVELSLDAREIDRFIELLQMIKADPDQHFHLTSDYKGEGGLGDIEVSHKDKDQTDNMRISGRAFAPGDKI